MKNNTQALHKAGHQRRIENFKFKAIANKIAFDKKMEKMEMFYQNTILLLAGFKPMKIAR